MANDGVQIFLMIGMTGSSANPIAMQLTPTMASVRTFRASGRVLTSNSPAITPKIVFAVDGIKLIVAYDPDQFLWKISLSSHSPILASFIQGPRTPGALPN